MTTIQLRELQKAVVEYEGGKMGVSAVPGSGKTFTLSYLAANSSSGWRRTGASTSRKC